MTLRSPGAACAGATRAGRWLTRFTTFNLILCSATSAAALEPGHIFEAHVRTLPALVYLPLGGELKFNNSALQTYFVGACLDLFNVHLDTGSSSPRLTILSLQAYAIGVSYLTIAGVTGSEKTTAVNTGMFHAGPHYTFARAGDALSLGFQIGYAAVAFGDTLKGETKVQHGIDLGFTFTWTSPRDRCYERHNDDLRLIPCN